DQGRAVIAKQRNRGSRVSRRFMDRPRPATERDSITASQWPIDRTKSREGRRIAEFPLQLRECFVGYAAVPIQFSKKPISLLDLTIIGPQLEVIPGMAGHDRPAFIAQPGQSCRMIEMMVGEHDGAQVPRPNPMSGESSPDRRFRFPAPIAAIDQGRFWA